MYWVGDWVIFVGLVGLPLFCVVLGWLQGMHRCRIERPYDVSNLYHD